MAVYTDGIHLMGDTVKELHKFAELIGLNRKGFRDYRYQYYEVIFLKDIEKAIELGAIVVDTRDLVTKFRFQRKLTIIFPNMN